MEHDSSFKKQRRKKITARAVVIKKMLEVDMDEKNKKLFDLDEEINSIEKAIRRRKQKDWKHRELSSRLIEWNVSKTDIGNEIDAFKQIILDIEEVEDQVKLKIKELKKKFKNIPKGNPFDFTEYAEKQEEDNEMDFG